MVLGAVRWKVEQAMRGKLVNPTRPWSLWQFLPPGVELRNLVETKAALSSSHRVRI